MRRVIQLAALAAIVAAALYAPSAAAPATITDGTRGPLCADITNGGPVSLDSSGNLLFVVNTQKKSCSDVFYTVTVYPVDSSGTNVDLAHPSAVTVTGSGYADAIEGPQLFVTIPGVSGQFVCVSAQSADKQGHVFDTAPDVGSDPPCVIFDLSGFTSPYGSFG